MNLFEYLKSNCGHIVNEAVQIKNLDRTVKIIKDLLAKKKIYSSDMMKLANVDGVPVNLMYVFNTKGEAAAIAWSKDNSAEIQSVLFGKNLLDLAFFTAGKLSDVSVGKADVCVLAKGASIMKMTQLIIDVLTGKVRMDKDAITKEIKGAQLFEAYVSNPDADELERLRYNLYMKIRNWKKSGKDTSALDKEYEDLTAQYQAARVKVKTNVTVEVAPEPQAAEWEKLFEEELESTPEERFQEMGYYIDLVLNGVKPLCLLCGAPGVGKTYRIMQQIKAAGKEQNVDYALLKGKSTSRALYEKLHDFKRKDQFIVMDDCDAVFKDEDSINLLKAAFDSSKERWVSWNIATPMPMDKELAEQCDDAVWSEEKGQWFYPKEFLYEGGGIIITNYSAGQIDTAIRSRALLCDLHFTTEEVVEIIRSIAPHMEFPAEAKDGALDFLLELAKADAPIEISLRTFATCCTCWCSNAPLKDKRRMALNQLKLQFLRGGKKY